MKKILLFAIIIGGSVAFTSCSKDEQCVDGSGNKVDTVDLVGVDYETECALAGGTIE